jgi:dTDP-4-amino-4,6-dideoxygalactose transaminase/GNAT superfamily N-acetyltransferase
MNIPFSPPDITDLEMQEVVAAMRSGWITTGPKTKLFEKKIAEYCCTSKAVCLNSATAAMEMTLRVLGVGPGDEVITSAYTYTASASVILHVGAKIVLVDVAAGSFHMDPDKLADAITERTKVVIPVDIGGVMCNYDAIYEVLESKKHLYHPGDNEYQKLFDRVIVVADAAHSFGATYNGQKCGLVADFSCFSFHAVKNLTTAEGGAITWLDREGIDSGELYNLFMLYSLHGQSKDALAKMCPGAWEYDIVYPAYKCNMTDLTAAMGLVQLQRFDGLSERRKYIIREYDKVLLPLGIEHLEHFGLNIGQDFEGNGHLYLVRIAGITESKRNEIIVKMAEAGIACNVHFKPLPMHTAYKNLGFDIKDYPWAYRQYANEITLPLHTLLTDEGVEYVAQTMKSILEGDKAKKTVGLSNIGFKRVFDTDYESIRAIYSIIKECGEKMFLDDGLLHWADPLPVDTIKEECLDKHVYLACENSSGLPVAFISVTTKPSVYFAEDPDCAYIGRMAVATELWRQGIGNLCIEKAVQYAQKKGCKRIRTTVYDKSDKAIAFFQKEGFGTLYSRPSKHFTNLCIEKEI